MVKKIDVQIVSKEMIKPSIPTPNHLRNLKLSFLDQLAPPIYIPIVLFYPSEQQNVDPFETSLLLKMSLSKTLTQFYPLAGTMKEDFTFECNDEGVEYFETKVPCKLTDITENPDVNVLNQFLPFEPQENCIETSKKQVPLAVQYNIFECGGIAIGIRLSHLIADGTSVITFVNAWAAMSRQSAQVITPIFEAATHFPPRDISIFRPNIGITKDKIVTKRFVFDKSSIAILREKASQVESTPTRVEAVSSFIWSRQMAISKTKTESAKLYAAVHAVNLRERMEPALPKNSFGNFWRMAIAIIPAEMEQDSSNHLLVSQMRNSIRKIDINYVKMLQDGDMYLKSMKMASEQFSKSEVEFCNFTSWCRFPVYEVDFGWGKPSWACSPSRPYKNLVILMSNKEGDGIEAWVNLLEEDMAVFERDPELLSFASSQIGN
ncbi:Transferase [Corchorus olitorius]|uniref:Transferase n=1 Tax=Corchorus olitorius TaxID=93759 RepID=A0A1R3JFG9_9ROSI|nr:Transferase [Corchorus olitorius]